MVRLGFEPGTAGWWAQTNPLSYGDPKYFSSKIFRKMAHSTMRLQKEAEVEFCDQQYKNHFCLNWELILALDPIL